MGTVSLIRLAAESSSMVNHLALFSVLSSGGSMDMESFMTIQAGDVFEAVVRRSETDEDSNQGQRIRGYQLTILSVAGEKVVYQRVGSAPSETTLAILRDAVHRGDLVKISGEQTC
jgi:hypothetical protein